MPRRQHFGPDPAVAVYLFAGLTTTGLLEKSVPRKFGRVVGVNRVVDVKGILQVLLGASVDHGPLLFGVSKLLLSIRTRQPHTRVGVSEGTQEMKMILLLK